MIYTKHARRDTRVEVVVMQMIKVLEELVTSAGELILKHSE